MRLVREVENGDAEDKCLSEYRREMELLLQEKMSHVEELRQIHADINAVNKSHKNVEISHRKAIGSPATSLLIQNQMYTHTHTHNVVSSLDFDGDRLIGINRCK